MTARSFSLPETEGEIPEVGNARPIEVSNEDISRFRSILSAPIKGVAKGTVDLLKLGVGILDPTRKTAKYTDAAFKKADEKIEENIPTRPEVLEKTLERFGKLAPLAATGGTGGLVRAGLGAVGGQAVEELGGGPFAQAVAEAGPFAIPGAGRRIIASSADQRRILETGRRFGMTEEQLAPLMPETSKKRFFGRFASTGESVQEPLRQTRQGIQNIYQALEGSPAAGQMLSPQSLNQFVQETDRIAMRMPHAIRSQLQNDAADLVAAAQQSGGVTGEQLINFYHDVSSRYNLGRSQLELFKNPIRDAIRSIDPQLANDFETANRMYQKSAQIGRILRPSEYEDLISLGEAYELAASTAKLDVGRLTRLMGVVGFRKFAEKMLTSPRLQNIIAKTQQAVIDHNLPMLKKLGELLETQFEKEDEDQE